MPGYGRLQKRRLPISDERGKENSLKQMQFSQSVGNQYAGEKDHAGNADERYQEIKGFFETRQVGSSDGAEIDQNAETQPEKKRSKLYHGLA